MLTKKTIITLISVMLVLIGATTAKGATIYVDDDANTGGGGSSWSDAYKYLQDGLNAASSNDEIRVAQGVYVPDTNDSDPNGSGSRYATFQLLDNVTVKGGYAGIGVQDPNERAPNTYETILSGDLDGDDVEVDPWDLIDETNRAENSYTVVTGSGTDETAVLDGFTITGGQANDPNWTDHRRRGGGMYNDNGSPTVTDCKFIANSAISGGGMNNWLSDPSLTNCMFNANYGSNGGGMFNWESSPIVNTCTFTGNSFAGGGGGMHNGWLSNTVVTNCMFLDNSSVEYGSGGGMYSYRSDPVLNSCIFSGNSAGWGGGMCSDIASSATLTNCTFSENYADVSGGGIINGIEDSNSTLTNCILWGNDAGSSGDEMYNNIDSADSDIAYCNIQGSGGSGVGWDANLGNDLGGNIDEDPLFVDPNNGDYHLGPNSPCINVGDPNGDYTGQTDIDGQPRVMAGRVDMGSDEFSGIFNMDKEQWYDTIQEAIDDANAGDSIEVGPGVYYETVDFNGVACTVRSTDPNDDDVVAATIIDANGAGRVVTFDSSEDANSILTGFTITGGYVSGTGDGAGIYCYGSSPTISRCVIYDNNSGDDGGGISCDNSSSPTISFCLITSNEAGDGGGICCNNSSSPTISYCEINDNQADDKGGGIYCKANSCSTIKDCDISLNSANMGGGVYCNASDPDIEDCNVRDNYAGDDAGGIYCYSGSDPTISFCEITDNEAEDKGGGIYCKTNSNPTIKDCEINLNNAYMGGGIYCASSEPQIERCIVSGNQTSGDGLDENYADGGGIYCSLSDPSILNCIISDNVSDDDAGGIYCYNGSDPNIINCTLTGNEADDKGGGIYCKDGSDPEITNCILWDDTAVSGSEIYTASSSPVVSYSDVEGGWSGAYNINNDPCFVDPNNDDFHLGTDSPCINAGDPNGDYTGQTDIDGQPRVMAGRVDMGSDEFSGIFNMDKEQWYDTIQEAIDYANAGDSIEVGPGVYYESVDFNGVACTIRSTDPNDWGVIADTIIDVNDPNAYVVTFENSEEANSVLTGFTVRRGGVGVYCDWADPTISNCIIEENALGAYGHWGSVTIDNCLIKDNDLFGIYVLGSPTIRYNKISGHYYDGIYLNSSSSSSSIKSNWIYDNGRHGLMILAYGSIVIRNNTIFGNQEAGIYKHSGPQPSISNCILWGNDDDLYDCTATYSCIEDCNDAGGVGNICGDANDPNFVDPNNDDYHLDPNSPCIDVGDPNGTYTGEEDIDGDDRVIDIAGKGDGIVDVDMGGDEHDPNS